MVAMVTGYIPSAAGSISVHSYQVWHISDLSPIATATSYLWYTQRNVSLLVLPDVAMESIEEGLHTYCTYVFTKDSGETNYVEYRIYHKLETTYTPNYSPFKTARVHPTGIIECTQQIMIECTQLLFIAEGWATINHDKGRQRVHYYSDMWLHGGLTFHCGQLPSTCGHKGQPVYSLPYHTHTQGSLSMFHKRCIPTSMYIRRHRNCTNYRPTIRRTVQGAQLNCTPILETEREMTMNTTIAHFLR